jgi:hypothetical protein
MFGVWECVPFIRLPTHPFRITIVWIDRDRHRYQRFAIGVFYIFIHNINFVSSLRYKPHERPVWQHKPLARHAPPELLIK